MKNKICIKKKRKHISNLLHSWTSLKSKSKITYHMLFVLYRWIISYCTLHVEAFYQINVIISLLGSQKNPVNIGFHMTRILSIFLKWMKNKNSSQTFWRNPENKQNLQKNSFLSLSCYLYFFFYKFWVADFIKIKKSLQIKCYGIDHFFVTVLLFL